jgi:hypothetical protein
MEEAEVEMVSGGVQAQAEDDFMSSGLFGETIIEQLTYPP